jgi:hypothetical protein
MAVICSRHGAQYSTLACRHISSGIRTGRKIKTGYKIFLDTENLQQSKVRTTVFSVFILALGPTGQGADAKPAWRVLQPGLEYASIDIGTKAEFGDDRLHVVRVDPTKSKLIVLLTSEVGGNGHRAEEWCKERRLAVAMNLGMFQADHRTNVGYARNGTHVNNKNWSASYKSVLAFGPKNKGIPEAIMVDLDETDSKKALENYETVIQNLRLIKSPGKNVWQKQEKRWSEAAVALDDKGRILFLFCRSPFSMDDFNRIILSLPLGITRAMHVEGGPEASLSIHTRSVNLDLCGSYETGFTKDDLNVDQWPIPNLLGVIRR